MSTDPIADMLTRIRNAMSARKTEVRLPHSKQKLAILQLMEKNGFVAKIEEDKTGPFPELVVELPADKKFTFTRISKPGRRIYSKSTDLKPVLSGLGIAVLSTSEGLMTNSEAHKKGIGGEIICEIY
ncbi:MAG: 30S ribosomal protein S8 [Candidatus Gracilibacteria bacterium]|nr:30S ribosomal protein S8 [Candidatus Gracilibacteria bacterium]MDD5178706.1 30S ribosomal protein S8 [Candidatus Gracilibacteria bacterium]